MHECMFSCMNICICMHMRKFNICLSVCLSVWLYVYEWIYVQLIYSLTYVHLVWAWISVPLCNICMRTCLALPLGSAWAPPLGFWWALLLGSGWAPWRALSLRPRVSRGTIGSPCRVLSKATTPLGVSKCYTWHTLTTAHTIDQRLHITQTETEHTTSARLRIDNLKKTHTMCQNKIV